MIRVDEVLEEVETIIGLDSSTARVSAKTGLGIDTVFKAIIDRIPAPKGDPAAPLSALVFDSKYDHYRGVITYIRVMEGTVKTGDKVRFMKAGTSHEVLEIGRFRPDMTPVDSLSVGEVGYIISGLKVLGNVHVGDTVTHAGRPTPKGAARLSRAEADGVLRHVPRRRHRLRAASRGAAEDQPERRGVHIRAGNQRCPRVRLPLRLPGDAAHGGAAAAT
ncbi:MAG: EF-Tu/IF-2/RF-3 family GTPase [Planctomycetaceae bacterium]